jgi:CheY-like chemotaxis protein
MMEAIWASFITTKGEEHVGLGLPACLQVIAQLGGRITADSQPGAGATFTILLPATPGDGSGQISDLLSAAPDEILLIDDDDDWAQFVTDTLKAVGRRVTRQETVNGIDDAKLILVDETLMAEPVAEILDRLQAAGVADKTVVVASAMKVERTTAHMQAGIRDVALKPYTPAELAEILT